MARKRTGAAKKTTKRSHKKARGKKRTSLAKAKGGPREVATSATAPQETLKVEAGPESPALNLAAIDALSAVTEQLIRVEQELAKAREARDKDQREHRAAWGSVEQAVRDLQARTARAEESQRQPVEDKSMPSDADPVIVERRRMLAGFCKYSKLEKPTPAILGRALDQENAYERESSKSPFVLFNTILTNYRAVAGSGAGECPHLASDTVDRLTGKSGHKDAANEKHYRQKCDNGRMPLLVNTGLAKMEKNKRGEFDRYLSVEGRECFNGWPDWADASGGLALADPPPPSVSTEPEAAASSPGSPETGDPAAAAGEGHSPAGGSIDAPPPESPDA